MTTPQLYEDYRRQMQRIADVRQASAVLQWDQETYLPPKGAHFRGQQISTLSELAHQLFVEESFGNLLHELMGKEDLPAADKRNVELTLEDYTKAKKYTSLFVRKMAEQVAKTYHAWIEARKQNSFKTYEKDLSELVKLKREESEILGYKDHPYNAHLNEYEKGATVALVDTTFDNLLPQLKQLLDKIAAQPQVDDRFFKQHFPAQAQWDWGMHLLKELHFDFERGRQDVSEHPFSISFSPQDVRITTRIDEGDFNNMTWSCIHEVGHALYEQGLPPEQYGLPLGEACSFSIHESQSRLWENHVGRSLPFWEHYYGPLQQRFEAQLGKNALKPFYQAINKVQPSLIRTEADEITYHFHVAIRYELEKALLEGSLATADIPDYWNRQYKKYLNVTVPDDKSGCLQDVHWSHGSFGYFPTYSLGSFYAAQFYTHAVTIHPNIQTDIAQGHLLPLLQWLRTHIHSQGRFYTSEELCRHVTGEPLNVAYFSRYLLEKFTSIYNL